MKSIILFTVGVLSLPIASHAAYTVKDGRLINVHELATLSVQEHYSLLKEAVDDKSWLEVIKQGRILIKNFPTAVFALDSYFYLGVAYFNMQELDFANQNFGLYLKKQTSPKFFEEAIQYKFAIAKQFEKGEKRRLLGKEDLPKWMPARQEAIAIYDEVIMALPQHDLAVESLFGKARVLLQEEEFKSSIETLQTLLRRFPKHPLACDSYIAIVDIYREQAEKEYPDPDYLDLAEITVRKFKMDFPGEPKVVEAERILVDMAEIYAKALYKTAEFYERTHKPAAAIIYYNKILAKYPLTQTAQRSQKRFDILQSKQKKKEEKIQIPKSDSRVIVEEEVKSIEPSPDILR